MRRRVAITGLGAVCPIGNDIEKIWDSLMRGESGIKEITAFDPSPFPTKIAGEVRDFDPIAYVSPKDARHMARFAQFAVASTAMALEDSGIDLSKESMERIGVAIGSGIGGIGVIEEQHQILMTRGPKRVSPFFIPSQIPNMASGQVAMIFGFKGPNLCVVTACASGNHSVGTAFRIIQEGEADIMIAGGSESTITPLSFAGFCAMRAMSTRNEEPEKASRPFDLQRDGFVMGEGCGVVVLEEMEHARRRGAKIYAELAGYGATADAFHMTQPDPGGEGAALCMMLSLRDAGMDPSEIDYINAHGTSTPLNDKIETLAIKRVFGDHAYKLAISSTKSMTGHLLGAAGGVELVITVLAMDRGYIPPTINYEFPDPECDLDYVPNHPRKAEIRGAMSNAFGFGGHNACIVLRKVDL